MFFLNWVELDDAFFYGFRTIPFGMFKLVILVYTESVFSRDANSDDFVCT